MIRLCVIFLFVPNSHTSLQDVSTKWSYGDEGGVWRGHDLPIFFNGLQLRFCTLSVLRHFNQVLFRSRFLRSFLKGNVLISCSIRNLVDRRDFEDVPGSFMFSNLSP